MMIESMDVDVSQSSEKFRHHANPAVQFLVDNLRLLDDLEKEISARMQLLKQEPEDSEDRYVDQGALWQEYARRCEAIITPIISKKYDASSRPLCGRSTYDYLNDASTKMSFIMKSASLATVEIHYDGPKDQFVLEFNGGTWKIRTKKHAYGDETTWTRTYL